MTTVDPLQLDPTPNAKSAPVKTPLYKAIHSARYQRQAVVRAIEERTGRTLLCYVAGSGAPISREDAIGFVDLLHNVHGPAPLDLLLHTGGGDIDAAEKLITMMRAKAGNELLRIIVPDSAKSAGTLMVLGADRVVMSDVSELGPIDPQVVLSDANGNRIWHSVQNYLDAFETFSNSLKAKPDDVAAQIMLKKLDPATVMLFKAVKDRARGFAEKQLKQGMFREGGNWSATVNELLDTKRWQSHGQMISWQDATDAKIGLKVDYLPPNGTEWEEYWQLYCMQRLSINDHQKLFESDYVSLPIDSST